MDRPLPHSNARQIQPIRDIEEMQRQIQNNTDHVEDIRYAARNDIQTLQKELHDMKWQLNQAHVRNDMEVARFNQPRTEVRGFDLAKALSGTARERIADAYRTAAYESELTARALRQQAEEISPSHEIRRIERATDALRLSGVATEGSIVDTPTHMPPSRGRGLRDPFTTDGGDPESRYTWRYDSKEGPVDRGHTIKEPDLMSENAMGPSLNATDHNDEADHTDETAHNSEAAHNPEASTGDVDLGESSEVPQEETAPENVWKPLAVRQNNKPYVVVPSWATETFSWETIKLHMQGDQWSPGFYFVSDDTLAPLSPLKGRAYWVLEGQYEPHLPTIPGHHGAKLTAICNMSSGKPSETPGEEDYDNLPVFICPAGEENYVYFGHYSQHRVSDKLDYDTLHTHVPKEIHMYWAEQLADRDRPDWITVQLMQHFWPKPEYQGPFPERDIPITPATCLSRQREKERADLVQQTLHEYAIQLDDWERDSRIKVAKLTAEDLMAAFANPDGNLEPGLRMWWEYLECVGWDESFYQKMIDNKRGVNPYPRTRKHKSRPKKAVQEEDERAIDGSKAEPSIPVVDPSRADSTRAEQVQSKPAEHKLPSDQGFLPPHLRRRAAAEA